MYKVVNSKNYKRSFKKISKRKDFNLEKLENVIKILKSGSRLPPQNKDHELQGNMSGIRECHIQNDILLMYKKEKDILILILVDIGTHSSLF